MVSSKAETVADYLAELPDNRREVIAAIRDLVNRHLPPGYDEVMRWGMITWEVPMVMSGPTYNDQPLAYAALAAQKNSNSLYLSHAFIGPDRTEKLQKAALANGKHLDMGKSCIRFKKPADLPLAAIGEEVASTTPSEWIAIYKKARKGGPC
jgi:hypothetical protein